MGQEGEIWSIFRIAPPTALHQIKHCIRAVGGLWKSQPRLEILPHFRIRNVPVRRSGASHQFPHQNSEAPNVSGRGEYASIPQTLGSQPFEWKSSGSRLGLVRIALLVQ
ncbi:hypothetical protein WR25_03236 [Diploscapter pachys]|uniref:Uncharacterized protein n=1 Tax=Diploscapter pachys TaxID=2018661 RepID=A0A2A2JQ41_9BILA|nr:hypothetical protein WR25_03236 [Diploscapter pachys]